MRKWIVDYLEKYFDEVGPKEFYRNIFPVGSLEERGKHEQGRYNSIAVELLPKGQGKVQAYRHIITDELARLDMLLESPNFIIISPISYAGKSRAATNARYIYAMAIDLDGITEEKYLRDLFFQIKNGFLPDPTYVVWSGTGIHLYYQFEQPLPCYKSFTRQLADLKRALTKKIWNKYTTSLWDKPQIESLFQGFRMVGGITKNGSRTRAFAVGKKISIEYLNEFVPEEARVSRNWVSKSKMTLEEAAEKYPEWYQKRIVEGKPKGTWTTKRDLFDWWVRRIEQEAAVGHRYFCIMTLAIYAKKAGIKRKELEEVAFRFVDIFDRLTMEESNRFTREDVLAALEMYNDNYITFPIDSIVDLTNIPIQKNKRNYLPQKVHLELARERKKSLVKAGLAKQGGIPRTKDKVVREWRQQHPEGSKAECARQTGISSKTVYKYWDI